jgi:hypothetical protein
MSYGATPTFVALLGVHNSTRTGRNAYRGVSEMSDSAVHKMYLCAHFFSRWQPFCPLIALTAAQLNLLCRFLQK